MTDTLTQTTCPLEMLSPLAQFDAAIQKVTQDRGAVYGHPLDNFKQTAALWSVVLGIEVTPLQVAQCMRMVKEARLIKTPDHLDSHIDIFGYARCAVMCIDRQVTKL